MFQLATSLSQQAFDAVVCHPHLSQRCVAVQANAGTVRLEGTVHSYFEKQLAQEALRSIEGITAIENQLQVQTGKE